MSSIASCQRGMAALATVARRAATATSARAMSANAKVWVDKDTRVICQGFTGKQVSQCNISLEEAISA